MGGGEHAKDESFEVRRIALHEAVKFVNSQGVDCNTLKETADEVVYTAKQFEKYLKGE